MNLFNFSHNSWHVKLWTFTYPNSSLPMSVCPYFWGLVVATVLFPVILMAHRIDNSIDWVKVEKSLQRIPEPCEKFRAFGLALLTVVVGLATIYGYGLQVSVLALILTGTVGFVFLVARLGRRYNHDNPVTNAARIVTTFTKAKKDSVCPLINWRDQE